MNDDVSGSGWETASTRLLPVWLVSVQVPEEEVEEILERLSEVAPLTMGAYDRCAFRSAPGIESYRPREGAAAGCEDETRHRPGVCEIAFQLPREQALLLRAVEAIAQAHSYEEPVITVVEALAARAKGGDRDNPSRWWNRTGDWKPRS